MGVPKRRQSKARVRARRAQWRKIDSLPLVECPKCRELKVPHRMCAACGFYKKDV
ncbi:MAG: 50S ribosomal protein L32, partial [Clostridia bacterium]|nr:50S ribosomal protein L32 [Clostridia bacterium]